jgi:hypothetical protein
LVLPFRLCLDFPRGFLHLDVHAKQCAVKNITIWCICNTNWSNTNSKMESGCCCSSVTINLFMYYKKQNILNVNLTAQGTVTSFREAICNTTPPLFQFYEHKFHVPRTWICIVCLLLPDVSKGGRAFTYIVKQSKMRDETAWFWSWQSSSNRYGVMSRWLDCRVHLPPSCLQPPSTLLKHL